MIKEQYHDEHRGVMWVKHQHRNIEKGYTTVIVDGEAIRFDGHTSNALAWNFIDRMLAKPWAKVKNGTITTKGLI